jgi:hypothetical protein
VLCCLQVSPESGWVPVWRGPIIAVVVLVCCLFSLLLAAILISHKLQSWLKVWQGASLSLLLFTCILSTLPGRNMHVSIVWS